MNATKADLLEALAHFADKNPQDRAIKNLIVAVQELDDKAWHNVTALFDLAQQRRRIGLIQALQAVLDRYK